MARRDPKRTATGCSTRQAAGRGCRGGRSGAFDPQRISGRVSERARPESVSAGSGIPDIEVDPPAPCFTVRLGRPPPAPHQAATVAVYMEPAGRGLVLRNLASWSNEPVAIIKSNEPNTMKIAYGYVRVLLPQ
jgi:hypothetical protein